MHRRTIVIAGVCIAAALVAGFILVPDLLYDRFIWKYFVGPVVADAVGEPVSHHGVEAAAGYTLLSELVYGLLLLVAFYGMYRVLQRLRIEVDARFIGAAMPYIVLGATLRTLEDSGLFQRPLTYLFISPVIYIQIGVYLALGLAIGILAGRASRARGRRIFVAALSILTAGYTLAYLALSGWMTAALSPFIVALGAIAAFICFMLLPHERMNGLFSSGLFFVLPSLYLIGRWTLGGQWSSYSEVHLMVVPLVAALATGITGLVYLASRWRRWQPGMAAVNLSLVFGHMVDGWVIFVLPSLYLIGRWTLGGQWSSYSEVHLMVVPLVAALATGITGLVYLASRWRRWQPGMAAVNLSLVFGHMVDGWVSYLAVVDPLGMGISYGEKHPLPLLLMEHGGGIAYPLAKLGIVLGIIYALDVYLRDELAGRNTLTGLIKLFVLVLGLSPGLRDLLRILMGI